jgi:histone acetyltransferase 1
MSGEISSKLFEKLKVYKNYSNDCIFFKYIFDESDIPDVENKKSIDTNVFKPEYTHQIFGDEEIIFGYKNLRIDYFLTPGNLDAYIGLSHKEKVSPQKFDGIEPGIIRNNFNINI